ncbi:MAG TPA: HAMP domain-containing sensor histidine kinase [Marinobacter sp.]|nr:HAMP domain-containing sensor histidine kinase [Marinobacter sp.]
MKRRIMFPLFWRIFLSIWLAMAITVVVSNLATRVLMDRDRQAIEHQMGLQDLALEAIHLQESQGRRAARHFLKTQGEQLELHLLLINKEEGGRRMPSSMHRSMNPGWFPLKPAIIDVTDDYQLVAWPRNRGQGWLNPGVFRLLELSLAFVLISLACWWIARMVSRPLRHMESTARTIAGGNNTLRVSDDIARRRDEVGQLATAFNAMTEQLCSLLDRQKQLLRDISHDLRTPLARQRIAIELANDAGADEELMASILRQNERLETMTSQILTLYRVAGMGDEFERESVRVSGLMNRVLGDAADYAEHRNVDCRLSVTDVASSVSVLGDAGLLQRAFDNILQNALDHTPPGRLVHVRVAVSENTVSIDIEDQGPGVSGELLTNLFEPFFRADPSRGGRGWGLGLTIARDIITAHDGELSASGIESGGLQITARLPVFTLT